MQAKRSEPPSEQDRATQRAIMSLALFEFPAHLLIPQLSKELAAGDAIERAIRELVTVNLLYRQGSVVLPAIAARHFEWLELS